MKKILLVESSLDSPEKLIDLSKVVFMETTIEGRVYTTKLTTDGGAITTVKLVEEDYETLKESFLCDTVKVAG